MGTYWEESGLYQAQYNEMFDKLIPSSGKCKTLGGEILRAVTRLYHDGYNNGFLNNTSGALNFLRYEWTNPYRVNGLGPVFSLLSGKVNTGTYSELCLKTEHALETLVNVALEWIMANPDLANKSNQDCMFDFQDETESGDDMCDDCGESEDYCECYNGSHCSECEERSDDCCCDEDEDEGSED